ncbi:InlB B-repeat-containing protein, partial [Agromyces humi]|uniref:InlB B-repeat-containing protein n=1 Tax=Agromyces humi TaxID=1766800 RepID=UPI001F45FF04
ALTAVALGAGLALVGVAAPASAHHNTITGVAACDAESSTFDITWTVQNSEAKVEKVLTSSDPDVVPVGTEIGKNKSEKFVEYGVEAGTYELTLKTEWSNGTQNTDTGRLTISAANCGDGTVKKITFCHATGSASNPYVRLTTSVSAFFHAGHIDHQDKRDIYPAFTYVKQGKTYNVAAQGDQSLLQYEDCVKQPTKVQVPTATFSDACGADNFVLTYDPALEGVTWNTVIASGKVTLTATVKAGYVFADGKTSKTFGPWSLNQTPCVTTIPVPSASFADDCGVDNYVLTYDADLEGVTWNKVVADGKVTLTATAKPNHVFADGTTSKTFGPWTLNQTPCVTTIPVPTATFADECGADNYALAYDQTLVGVVWNKVVADGKLTLTATPASGFAFEGGLSSKVFGPWELNQKPCPEKIAVPTASFVDECGVDNYVLAYDEQLVGVVWSKVVEGGTVTLTATPAEGYEFERGEASKTFGPWALNQVPCIVKIAVPTAAFEDFCGADNESVAYDKALVGVVWSEVVAGGKLTLTATPADGYAFLTGEASKVFGPWSLNDVPCVAPTLTGSVATGVCEADVPWITYSVALTDPDEQATSRLVTLVLSDGTNSERLELGELREDNTLTGKVLWPGASVAEDGVTPTGWPGWEKIGDAWVETDGNFAWTRGITTASFEVNPTLAVSLTYPEATPDCATGPKANATTAAAGGGTGLASTGFAGTTIAIVAGVIVIAGIAFLVIARIRRKRA